MNWPTRRSCSCCGTTRGPLRRRCPYCDVPVCNDCYPQRHAEQHGDKMTEAFRGATVEGR